MSQKEITVCDWCQEAESDDPILKHHREPHKDMTAFDFGFLEKAIQGKASSPPEHLCAGCVKAMVESVAEARRRRVTTPRAQEGKE